MTMIQMIPTGTRTSKPTRRMTSTIHRHGSLSRRMPPVRMTMEDVNKHTYGYENEDGTYTIVKGYVPPDQ